MRNAILELAERRGGGEHPGLILQKFPTDLASDDRDKARGRLLERVRQASGSDSLRGLYAAAFARWSQSFAPSRPQCTRQFATSGRLIVGLGSSSVLETGLRLHHTYGVPIIPGSALKGLASHFCDKVWGQSENGTASEENYKFRRGGMAHRLLFGNTEDGGVVSFPDAWITPDSLRHALCTDVMTPHHPKWQTNEAPPTDFDSPVPVSFLSVAGTFEVRVAWSGPVTEAAAEWTKLAMTMLTEALATWGVGGKTSTGYGRLSPVEAGAVRSEAPGKGDLVECRMEKTSKGSWRAVHEASGLRGPVVPVSQIPAETKEGDVVKLEVFSVSANKKDLQFRYPSATGTGGIANPAKGKAPANTGRNFRR